MLCNFCGTRFQRGARQNLGVTSTLKVRPWKQGVSNGAKVKFLFAEIFYLSLVYPKWNQFKLDTKNSTFFIFILIECTWKRWEMKERNKELPPTYAVVNMYCLWCWFWWRKCIFTEMYKLMEQQNLKYKTSTSNMYHSKDRCPKAGLSMYINSSRPVCFNRLC